MDSGDKKMAVAMEENQEEINLEDGMLRYELTHKRWTAVYDCKGSSTLNVAMIRHLYLLKFEKGGMATADDISDAYDLPSC